MTTAVRKSESGYVAPAVASRNRVAWFAVRQELGARPRLVLAFMSFALPLLLWSAVSYLPWLWHPMMEVTEPGEVGYFRAGQLVEAGVSVIALLALSDSGAPSYRHDVAAKLAGLGVPAFACTPALFPDLMAAAIQHRDLTAWAATNDIRIVR